MNTEQLEQRLAQAHRDLQATEQALLDERAAHRNDAVVAAAGRAFAEAATKTCDTDKEFDALLAACRATTPSQTPATHVVIAVDELERLKATRCDHLCVVVPCAESQWS